MVSKKLCNDNEEQQKTAFTGTDLSTHHHPYSHPTDVDIKNCPQMRVSTRREGRQLRSALAGLRRVPTSGKKLLVQNIYYAAAIASCPKQRSKAAVQSSVQSSSSSDSFLSKNSVIFRHNWRFVETCGERSAARSAAEKFGVGALRPTFWDGVG